MSFSILSTTQPVMMQRQLRKRFRTQSAGDQVSDLFIAVKRWQDEV